MLKHRAHRRSLAERFEHWQSAVRQHWGSGEPGDRRPRFPACTLIPVPKLALPGMLIEVEATAALPMEMDKCRHSRLTHHLSAS
jgi:enamine deaminase RidA (YjgF/YER057c/UK114 family)